MDLYSGSHQPGVVSGRDGSAKPASSRIRHPREVARENSLKSQRFRGLSLLGDIRFEGRGGTVNGGVPDARMDGMEIFESVQERKIKKGLKQTGANRCQAGNESRKRQGGPKANIENKPGKGGEQNPSFLR